MDDKEIIGRRIKKLRVEAGLGLEAVKQDTGLAISTLSAIENGNSYLRGDTLILLAEYYETTSDYLLGLHDSRVKEITIKCNKLNNMEKEKILGLVVSKVRSKMK